MTRKSKANFGGWEPDLKNMAFAFFDYSESVYSIRKDICDTYREVWQRICMPGNWWTGTQRVAIVAEARQSRDCRLCRRRADAISPEAIDGEHDSEQRDPLSVEAIDAIHRISNDAARLSAAWLSSLISPAFSYGHYVELVGVLVAARSIDTFNEALGLELEPLPEPEESEPSGYFPKEAKMGGGWVPILNGENLAPQDADIYEGLHELLVPVPNVLSAMSLVPDAVRMLFRLMSAQYLNMAGFTLFDKLPGRVLSRSQVELVAARVSALNDCFY